MKTYENILSFFISLVSFFVLDFLWFKFVVKDFNLKELAEIGRIKSGEFDILLAPAIGTYVLMALSIAVFIAPGFAENETWWKTFFLSACMGLIVYGIFEMTNLAILKNYPIKFMIVDMSWGTFVFGLVGCLTRWAHNTLT